jgi:hypothetical protein
MIPCPLKDLRDSSDGEKYCMYVAFAGHVPHEDDQLFDYICPGEQVYVTTTEEHHKRKISQDICKSVHTYTEEWLFNTGTTVHVTACKHLLFNTSNCCKEILLQSECRNFLVLQGVLYSLNKKILLVHLS